MPNNYFRFKQFTIHQERCAMKVGTDGVLLGAWIDPGDAAQILDIGTGTGLIALMLAQRSKAVIHAVEIDPEAAHQAGDNFRLSPWSERLLVFQEDFRDFMQQGGRYELIVTNPPYFSQALKASGKSRSMARHDHHLSINELMEGIVTLLSPNGRVGIVYPFDGLNRLENAAKASGLCLIRRTDIYPVPGKDPKRVLLELSRNERQIQQDSLIIEEFGRHRYSGEFIKLTRDFYL